MFKKILALVMLPVQIILLVIMLPLMLVFGSGLLNVLVPPSRRSRPTPPEDEDEEEIKDGEPHK